MNRAVEYDAKAGRNVVEEGLRRAYVEGLEYANGIVADFFANECNEDFSDLQQKIEILIKKEIILVEKHKFDRYARTKI